MHSSIKKFTVLIPVMLITLFLFAAQSEALVLADSSSTLDWNTFTVTLSPGISLAWQDSGLYSYATSRIDVGSTAGVVYDNHSVTGWSASVNSSASYPGIYHESSVNSTTGILYSYADVNNTGYERLHTQDTAQRTGYFSVVGSGTITFAIDYLIDSFASNSGPDAGYAGGEAHFGVTNLSISNVAGDYAIDKTISYAQLYSGETVSGFASGRLEVSYDFTQGQQGVLIAQAFSYATYMPLPRPVPEPSSLLLVISGLMSAAFLRRRGDR